VFDRFTEQARRVMTLARTEALRLRCDHIDTEHLCLARTRDAGLDSAFALCGTTQEHVRRDLPGRP
jgi:hypothetical protein